MLPVPSHVGMIACADGRVSELAVSVQAGVLVAALQAVLMNLRLELAVAVRG